MGQNVSKCESGNIKLTRRTVLLGASAGIASIATPAAPAVLRGKGVYRSLKVLNKRTDERLNTVYWVEGQYIPEALEAFYYIMRDWRENIVVPIDTRTIDIMAAVYNLVDTAESLEVISGYRSPRTNAMLRRRSRGVARNSYHMRGQAVDLTLKSRTIGQMAAAARSLKAGGVGRYSRAHFVHVDSGPVRDWGR